MNSFKSVLSIAVTATAFNQTHQSLISLVLVYNFIRSEQKTPLLIGYEMPFGLDFEVCKEEPAERQVKAPEEDDK